MAQLMHDIKLCRTLQCQSLFFPATVNGHYAIPIPSLSQTTRITHLHSKDETYALVMGVMSVLHACRHRAVGRGGDMPTINDICTLSFRIRPKLCLRTHLPFITLYALRTQSPLSRLQSQRQGHYETRRWRAN